jgi:hypothetical protein
MFYSLLNIFSGVSHFVWVWFFRFCDKFILWIRLNWNQIIEWIICVATWKHSQIGYNELVIEKEIGEGSYGKVYLGRWNDAPIALKFCRNKGNIDEFNSEIKIMVYVFCYYYHIIRSVDFEKIDWEEYENVLFDLLCIWLYLWYCCCLDSIYICIDI